MTILRIDSSANTTSSVTRDLTDRIIARLGDADVVRRDLADTPLPQITQAWAEARVVPQEARTEEQNGILALSDHLIAELRKADTVVIGVPVYNFGVPAALKAWIDLIARPGETFRYSAAGPEGLLKGKRAILAVASGGTPVGSAADFATGYMRHVLAFVGITEVEIVAADAMALDADGTLARAAGQIEALPIAA